MTSYKTIFGVDLRTLALVRVCLGALVIADLALRARDFEAHYTDLGALPRSALFVVKDHVPASLHLVSGAPWIMALLFVFAGLVGFALMIGYRSRLAALVSWVLVISLDARNQYVGQGGDMLLRMLLFWAMFLPIGARFSVDAALDPDADGDNHHFSAASVGLLVQVMCVYFFTALLKSDSVWLPDGTAVYYALSNDTLVTPVGELLRSFPAVMKGLTYFVWHLEILAPFLVFSPFFHVRLRLIALGLLIVMHIGFAACMRIGLFPPISITSLLALTPAAVWDWLGKRVRTAERAGIRVYYDGECLFCEKICLLMRTFLLLPDIELAPAQRDPKVMEVMERDVSWVVFDHRDDMYLRWPALGWLVAQSPLLAPLGWLLRRRWLDGIGERIYRFVAANRGRFSGASRVLLPYRRVRTELGVTANLVCSLFVVVVVWNNFGSLKTIDVKVPSAVRAVSSSLRLGQRWTMFAPTPSRTIGWFVAVGTVEGGATVDVFRDRVGDPSWRREDYLAINYRTYRWRKFLARLPLEERVEIRPYYLQYLCRDWNGSHAEHLRLESLKLYYVAEHLEAVGAPPRTQRLLTWKSECGDDPLSEVMALRRGVLPDPS